MTEIQIDSLMPVRRPDLEIINKKSTSRIVDSVIAVDNRMKIKENEETNTWILPEN